MLVIAVVFFAIHAFSNLNNKLNNKYADSGDRDTETELTAEQDDMYMTAAVADALLSPQKIYAVKSDTPQFIALSFDGSKSTPMLQETLDFQKKLQAMGISLRFTYFISGSYFLTQETGKIYQAPRQKAGASNIGFSYSANDIAPRVALFNTAHLAGNEVTSHSVGHFDGSNWTYDEWRQEFRQFNSILFHTIENNPSVKIDPWVIGINDIVGFRAPYLGFNQELYRALHDAHFIYDASGFARGGEWPQKDAYGIWRIPLGTVYIGQSRHPVIAMDYSIWKFQSDAKEEVKQGTDKWNLYLDDLKKAYRDYFDRNYTGSRAPVVIANHFAKWNDGVYWEAMKAFAQEECGKPNVRCVTFAELAHYMDTVGAPPYQ